MYLNPWRPSIAVKKRETPYYNTIDLCGFLALMVFFLALFMLPGMTVIDGHRGSVDMARVLHPKPQPGALREDALIVTLTRDDNLFVGDLKVTPDELVPLLKAGIHEASEHRLYLRIDAHAKYGSIKHVLDAIREAGIERVVLLTEAG